MSENKNFKTIKDLAKEVDSLVNLLNEGKLELKDIENLHGISRELYERITLVRYRAIEKESQPKVPVIPPVQEIVVAEERASVEAETPETEEKPESGASFKLNLSKEEIKVEEPAPQINHSEQAKAEKVDDISKNQISLLDEIEARSFEQSLNDKFAISGQPSGTLGEKLKKQPIKNLKESIGLNQKFLFMNDLFHGENTAYNEAVEKLNNFSGFNEARAFIVNDLSERYRWNGEDESVQSFMELVERRYLGS